MLLATMLQAVTVRRLSDLCYWLIIAVLAGAAVLSGHQLKSSNAVLFTQARR